MKTRCLLSLFLLNACVHEAPRPRAADPAAWYGDLHALAREAARVRGLELTVAFEVLPLEDAAFFARYREFAKLNPALQAELRSALKAFSFAGKTPLSDAATGAQLKSVQDEQLLAFYNLETHQLYVRARLPPVLASADDDTRLRILAHEVGHALQDQLGVAANPPTTFDAALARRAVLEGDATLTATLVVAARHHVTPGRAVERIRISTSALTDEQLLEAGGLGGGLLQATPLVREVFLFPYLRGQRFTADLFQTGGLPLVDAVLKHPPQRSDAILAPQRFLDGVPATLAPAPGQRRLGAVLLRMLFEQCFPTQARKYTEWIDRSYVDDAFTSEDGALEWTTAWDEPSADTSVRLGALARCLGLEPAQFATAQVGEVHGLAARTADDTRGAARAAALSRAPATAPPFGPRDIPEPRIASAYRAAGPGVRAGGTWSHQRLDLRLPLEPTDLVQLNPVAALNLTAPDHSTLVAMFLDEAPKPKTNDLFVNAFIGSVSSGGKGVPAGFSLARPHTWAAHGPALETDATFEAHGPVHLRARLIPVCDGQASVAVLALARGAESERTIARWLDGLEAGSNPPLCLEP